LGHISTHFWHGSRPVVIGPHTKCMTSMTSMTSTARVRARSRAPYIRKLFFLIFYFSKFQSVSPKELIQENRKMPSEWLGVYGGRSYGPSLRGSSLPGPASMILISKWKKMLKCCGPCCCSFHSSISSTSPDPHASSVHPIGKYLHARLRQRPGKRFQAR
jgi:hypothetical protein